MEIEGNYYNQARTNSNVGRMSYQNNYMSNSNSNGFMGQQMPVSQGSVMTLSQGPINLNSNNSYLQNNLSNNNSGLIQNNPSLNYQRSSSHNQQPIRMSPRVEVSEKKIP